MSPRPQFSCPGTLGPQALVLGSCLGAGWGAQGTPEDSSQSWVDRDPVGGLTGEGLPRWQGVAWSLLPPSTMPQGEKAHPETSSCPALLPALASMWTPCKSWGAADLCVCSFLPRAPGCELPLVDLLMRRMCAHPASLPGGTGWLSHPQDWAGSPTEALGERGWDDVLGCTVSPHVPLLKPNPQCGCIWRWEVIKVK